MCYVIPQVFYQVYIHQAWADYKPDIAQQARHIPALQSFLATHKPQGMYNKLGWACYMSYQELIMSATKDCQTPITFANPSVVEAHLCKLLYMENLCGGWRLELKYIILMYVLCKQFNWKMVKPQGEKQFFGGVKCPPPLKPPKKNLCNIQL